MAELPGGLIEEDAGRLEFGLHVGDLELQRLEVAEAFAEGLALLHIGDRLVESRLRGTQAAGGDIEPAAIEPTHRNREAHSFAADQMRCGHRCLIEIDGGSSLRLPAHLPLIGAETQALCAVLDQEAGNPLGPLFAGAAHHQIDVGIAAARDEGLGATHSIATVAVLHRPGFEGGGTGARSGFGQAVARDFVHGTESRKPCLSLLLCPIGIDHPGAHILDREKARHHRIGIRQFFKDEDGLNPRQGGSSHIFLDHDAAEPEPRRLLEHGARDRLLVFPLRREGCDLLGSKTAHHVSDLGLIVAEREIHDATLSLRRGEAQQFLAFADLVAGLAADIFDLPGMAGFQRMLHLHRFEHDERGTLLNHFAG